MFYHMPLEIHESQSLAKHRLRARSRKKGIEVDREKKKIYRKKQQQENKLSNKTKQQRKKQRKKRY